MCETRQPVKAALMNAPGTPDSLQMDDVPESALQRETEL